jgi:hypothetical protein
LLTYLINKDILFNFNNNYKKYFKKLYIALTLALILRHYYLKLKTIVETNTLNRVIVRIFL